MPAVKRDDARPGSGAPRAANQLDADPDGAEPADWVAALQSEGSEQVAALKQLHALMLRACGHQVWRMRTNLPDASPGELDLLVNQAADEAMTALLGKLHTFEGRSRFTTWAFKFAILQAATEVRRIQWQHREVQLRDLNEPPAPTCDSPELHAEGTALGAAVADAMCRVLTPYQRRIAVALLVDDVPIDVLADRLGTSRGALYKTLHDARVRLRAALIAHGYLPAAQLPPGPLLTDPQLEDIAGPAGGTP